MVIRSASHTDMLKIAPLVIDFRRELSQLRRKKSSISLDDAKKELEEYFNKNYPIFIAENDTKEILGYLVCKIDNGVVWAESVFVKEEFRRRGIASSLYEQAEKLAKDLGSDTVYNWVHPNNDKIIRFLKRRGFNVINLIELRSPKVGEEFQQKIKVGDYEFDY